MMDAARRWQIASLATALGGLGVGAMLIDRPTTEPVDPIILEVAYASAEPGETFRFAEPRPRPGPEIVTADVVSGTTPLSGSSVDSPDDGASSGGGTARTAPAPSPPVDAPESIDSPDVPESVDSDESVDSA